VKCWSTRHLPRLHCARKPRFDSPIRAELDEEALDAFHGTLSLPFAAGDNRKVAVKIVDDRGIESLRIVGLED